MKADERRPAGGVVNAFSVDVEDYFQVEAFVDAVDRSDWDGLESRVERNTDRILEMLSRHGVRGTFFFLGWVAERCPDLVRRCLQGDHEIAVHGYDHKRVTLLSPEEFRADVRKTKRMLEDLSGAEVVGYRAPTYSIVHETLWALEVLAEEGYLYDSSIFPIRHDRYGIPDAPRFPWAAVEANGSRLIEFPISTVRCLGTNLPFIGGGYLRHFPAAFMHWGVRRLNRKERKPVMLYIHPWEVDPDQPRLPVGRLTTWRHYGGLAKVEGRLEDLLGRFAFTTVRGSLESLLAQ